MNWNEIQHEWETTKITLAKLAEKYEMPLGTIKSRKSRDAKDGNPWSRDGTKKVATKRQKVATIKKDAEPIKKAVESEESTVNENGDLTDKQWLFCLYYTKYWSPTKAYQKSYDCDYSSAKANGYKLLRNIAIKKEIDRMKKELEQETFIESRAILQKYIDIAFVDMTDFIDFTQVESEATETEVEFNPDGSKKSEKTEVVPYTYTKFAMHNSEDVDGTLITEMSKGKDGMFKIKLADKMAALSFLAKFKDLLNENERKQLQTEQARMNIDKTKADIAKVLSETKGTSNNHTISVDLSGLTTEELRALAKRK